MEEITRKKVTLTREAEGVYIATNAAGAQIRFGSMADDAFGPVELLLAAVAGCSGVDVDVMTSRRAEPVSFEITSEGDYVRGEDGNILRDIQVTFHLAFPEGEDGDKARSRIAPALKSAHDRTCTVSRTLEHGATVTLVDAGADDN